MDYLLVALGLSGLVAGGEFLVRGAVGLTAWLRVPPLLIGLTVVGFGTSTPELLVSVGAALRGVPDIAVGNVVGSNIANILLIIGMAALIWPMTVAGATLRRDTGAMMLATLAVLPVFAIGAVGRLAGLVLVALLATYLLLVYLAASQSGEDDTPVPPVWKSAIWALAGLALLMVGARLLLDGSVALARGFGVSEAFIGLTVVAVGDVAARACNIVDRRVSPPIRDRDRKRRWLEYLQPAGRIGSDVGCRAGSGRRAVPDIRLARHDRGVIGADWPAAGPAHDRTRHRGGNAGGVRRIPLAGAGLRLAGFGMRGA